MEKLTGMSVEYWATYGEYACEYAKVPQAERLERFFKAVRVIKALGKGAHAWRSEWYLHTLGWVESCADEVREEYEVEKAKQANA